MTPPSKRLSYSAIMGWVLKNRRAEMEFSQGDIARVVGMSQSAWAKIEKGVVLVNPILMLRFAEATKLPVVDIYSRIAYMTERCRANGHDIYVERIPTNVRDASDVFMLGAGLGGFLATILSTRDDSR